MNDQQLLRYSRQILLEQIDIDGQQRLLDSKVLIVGLGGLGGPAALYLAGAGVGTLVLADDDHVDLTNLQRQIIHGTADLDRPKTASAAGRLAALNPEVRVQQLDRRLLGEQLSQAVQGVDVVLDCTDNFTTRQAINSACVAQRRPLVSGAAIRLQGQVSVFDSRRADSPCYQCLYGDGDDVALSCSEAGVIGPLVGMVGSLQALEALKLLAGFGEPLVGRLLLIDALQARFRELRIQRDPGCTCCGTGHA
ncbi:molybdopterin-synthase adenylyltransferase MoeB [Pseudomonas sp. MYb185]|uniref:molybdopterin-synthase adenylyltransferase MoeB n=1 Tax=Pseudomonas sp. MYb185 TaxID=1848729 RepID=UPI000CFE224A|nr:molybdopterin-synthase adenylyltransferase MoeB [Pseudomonas sp. MYb185]PRB80270.1 molybdopterin-synthase adenylyltransferase MoeB [Pseudomonas sp. MYb185]